MQGVRVLRKVKLDGKWVLAVVPVNGRGQLDGKHVLRKGELVAVTAGTFYLDAGRGANRTHVACGSSVEAAQRAMVTQAHVAELRRRGMEIPDAPEIAAYRASGSDSIAELARIYAETPPTGLRPKTQAKYRNAFASFSTWAARVGIYRVGDVTAEDMRRWILHMQQRERLDGSTITPKVRIVLGGLADAGNRITLPPRTLPRPSVRERSIYTTDELQALLAACKDDLRELVQVFMQTGFRYQEVAHLAWSDIDAMRLTVSVTRKPQFGFEPKTFEERTIPVPRELIALLEARRARLGIRGDGLVFATSTRWARAGAKGNAVDRKMLDKVRAVALRAGLNCGMCKGSAGGREVSCATHAVCKRWGLHKFRHTYATMLLRDKVDIVTVSEQLGHKDIATTRIYLRALRAEVAQPQIENSTLAKLL